LAIQTRSSSSSRLRAGLSRSVARRGSYKAESLPATSETIAPIAEAPAERRTKEQAVERGEARESESARARGDCNAFREVELGRKRGQLIDRDAVLKRFAYVVIVLKQRFLLLPGHVARSLVGLTEHTIKLKLDAAIREALNELADERFLDKLAQDG
jgi:hypothetical protein